MVVGWIIVAAVVIGLLILGEWTKARSRKKYRRQIEVGEREPTTPRERSTRRAIGFVGLSVILVLTIVHFLLTYHF